MRAWPSVSLTSLPAALLLACAAPVAHAKYYGGDGGYGGGQVFRCESRDGRQAFCAVDTRYGVRITRQLSDSACIEGRTWGQQRDGVWVAAGCRAEFVVGGGYADNGYGNGGYYGDDRYYGSSSYGNGYYGNGSYGNPGYGNDQTFICESRNGRQNYCAVGNGRVVIVRQLSSNVCQEGRTWGQDGRGVWVSQGCRARFQVVPYGRGGRYGGNGYYGNEGGYGNGGGYYGNGGYGSQVIRCESRDGRQSFCPADTRYGVRIARQISSSACIEGQTWGAQRDGVWVTGGCRAEFALGR